MRPAILSTPQVDWHRKSRDLDANDMEIMELPVKCWDAKREGIGQRSRGVIDTFIESKCEPLRQGDPTLYFLAGNAGTGKTSAAAVLAKAARSFKYTAFFIDAGSIQRLFIEGLITNDGEQTYRQRCYTTDCLVIDGLGRSKHNDFLIGEISSIITHRQDNLKMTIVTTTLTVALMLHMFGPDFTHKMRNGVEMVDF